MENKNLIKIQFLLISDMSLITYSLFYRWRILKTYKCRIRLRSRMILSTGTKRSITRNGRSRSHRPVRNGSVSGTSTDSFRSIDGVAASCVSPAAMSGHSFRRSSQASNSARVSQSRRIKFLIFSNVFDKSVVEKKT